MHMSLASRRLVWRGDRLLGTVRSSSPTLYGSGVWLCPPLPPPVAAAAGSARAGGRCWCCWCRGCGGWRARAEERPPPPPGENHEGELLSIRLLSEDNKGGHVVSLGTARRRRHRSIDRFLRTRGCSPRPWSRRPRCPRLGSPAQCHPTTTMRTRVAASLLACLWGEVARIGGLGVRLGKAVWLPAAARCGAVVPAPCCLLRAAARAVLRRSRRNAADDERRLRRLRSKTELDGPPSMRDAWPPCLRRTDNRTNEPIYRCSRGV